MIRSFNIWAILSEGLLRYPTIHKALMLQPLFEKSWSIITIIYLWPSDGEIETSRIVYAIIITRKEHFPELLR